jgi:hypothetical protein
VSDEKIIPKKVLSTYQHQCQHVDGNTIAPEEFLMIAILYDSTIGFSLFCFSRFSWRRFTLLRGEAIVAHNKNEVDVTCGTAEFLILQSSRLSGASALPFKLPGNGS